MARSNFKFVSAFVFICLVKGNMAQVESADLNLDDILNVNLMPSALFLHQDVPVISNNSVPEVKVKGDFSKAYELMGFHRYVEDTVRLLLSFLIFRNKSI